MKEYEERAVLLATNPSMLTSLTTRLREVRMSCPLFDTARWVSIIFFSYLFILSNDHIKIIILTRAIFFYIFSMCFFLYAGKNVSIPFLLFNFFCVYVYIQVKNLERAYFKMWNLYCTGKHPQSFKVLENDAEFPFDQ